DGIRVFHVTGVQTCALPISTLPDCSAGFTSTDDDEKSPYTVQPRLHCAQKKHAPRSLLSGSGLVKMESREGITGMSNFFAPSLMKSSWSRGFGGGRKMPSGSLKMPSFDPKTPMSWLTLS